MARRIFDWAGVSARLAIVLFALAISSGAFANESAPAHHVVTIATNSGNHSFQVEIMRTAEERSKGLMFRKQLQAKNGMLFDFGREGTASMWMKNTFIPLDMVFIRSDGVISNIAANTVPHSLDVISSTVPVKYVLEINAGTAKRLGIIAGNKVTIPEPRRVN